MMSEGKYACITQVLQDKLEHDESVIKECISLSGRARPTKISRMTHEALIAFSPVEICADVDRPCGGH